MTTSQTITTRSGVKLAAQVEHSDQDIKVFLRGSVPARCFVHWGLRRRGEGGWTLPSPAAWPPGTVAAGQNAAQTPLPQNTDAPGLVFKLNGEEELVALEFVLFYADQGRWDNNSGCNYQVLLQP